MTRQEGDIPTPSSPNINKRIGPNAVGSPSNTSRESAYIYGFHALCPPPTPFATSYAFFVFQVGYFNRAKRCAVHRNALPARFVVPFTNVSSRLSCPVERDPEGAHIVRHPSFQLEGVPLPRVDIPVAPACLSEDLLCRCLEILNPAVPYTIQNSLQPVATFQVTYQMKILTTAAFSVALLHKSLLSTKWKALCFLALEVSIVQLQSISACGPTHKSVNVSVGSAHDAAQVYTHIMSSLKGFGAVTAACFTSGLAGVYFEMVLKGSKADLWVRNVQLSLSPSFLHCFPSSSPIAETRKVSSRIF